MLSGCLVTGPCIWMSEGERNEVSGMWSKNGQQRDEARGVATYGNGRVRARNNM